MDPLNDDHWKASKLLTNPYLDKRKNKWGFVLLWIHPSRANEGKAIIKKYKYVNSTSCKSYNTEEECIQGSICFIENLRIYNN